MAHSDFYPYPLPFPNEEQRILISSYSSLAGALGTDPVYASRHVRRPPAADCDAVVGKQAIYLDNPPVSTPSYPYPARNVLSPGTYPARTPFSVSNGRPPNNTVARGQHNDRKELFRLPAWYDHLPQPVFAGPNSSHGYPAETEFPAIHFLRKGDRPPYTLWDLLTMDTMPDLVDGDVLVFGQNPERWIKIKLIWPGYSHYPFEKRISVKQGAPLTPSLLLMRLAYHTHEFVRNIHGTVVEPGQERWAITGLTEIAPPLWKTCVITSLQHVMGSTWQPEIYYPRGGQVTASR